MVGRQSGGGEVGKGWFIGGRRRRNVSMTNSCQFIV